MGVAHCVPVLLLEAPVRRKGVERHHQLGLLHDERRLHFGTGAAAVAQLLVAAEEGAEHSGQPLGAALVGGLSAIALRWLGAHEARRWWGSRQT